MRCFITTSQVMRPVIFTSLYPLELDFCSDIWKCIVLYALVEYRIVHKLIHIHAYVYLHIHTHMLRSEFQYLFVTLT